MEPHRKRPQAQARHRRDFNLLDSPHARVAFAGSVSLKPKSCTRSNARKFGVVRSLICKDLEGQRCYAESWICEPGIPEKHRGQRGDDGASCPQGVRNYAARRRSRRFESVVREAENLARAGVREISLIGQDTTFYGEDLGIRDGLAHLLDRLAETEGLHRTRFLYCYPNPVSDRLLDTLAPEIDGKVFITAMPGVNDISELPPPGTLASVEITEARDYDLVGRVVEFRESWEPRHDVPSAQSLPPVLG